MIHYSRTDSIKLCNFVHLKNPDIKKEIEAKIWSVAIADMSDNTTCYKCQKEIENGIRLVSSTPKGSPTNLNLVQQIILIFTSNISS